MKEEFNNKRIESLIRELLIELGDDPNRPGLIETPKRVAKMYQEVFEGMRYSNKEIAEKYDKCFESESTDLVTLSHIPIFSYCEHHLASMYNMEVNVAYIPNGKVIGLSKVARVAEMVGKRLQLQERIGDDIADILQDILNTDDVLVMIKGEHSCMTARGVKSRGTVTKTAAIRGAFKNNIALRDEAYKLFN